MDDEKPYRGAEPAYVREIGKIAMAGAVLENALYEIADALVLDPVRSRTLSGSRAAQEVREAVLEKGTLPWMATTKEDLAAWASEAKGALKERGKVIHSVGYQRRTDDNWRNVRVQTGASGRESPADLPTVQRLRVRLDELARQGSQLHIGMLLMAAPGVYMKVWGGESGGLIIQYEDGVWPEISEDREQWAVDTRLDDVWAWGMSFLQEGSDVVAHRYVTETGTRLVPPWVEGPRVDPTVVIASNRSLTAE